VTSAPKAAQLVQAGYVLQAAPVQAAAALLPAAKQAVGFPHAIQVATLICALQVTVNLRR